MRLLKRQEIIEAWNEQNEETKNMFCCPSCRDILDYDNSRDVYYCNNFDCNIDSLIIDKDNYVIDIRKG